MIWNLSYDPETLKSGQNLLSFDLFDLELWPMTFKISPAPIQYHEKLPMRFHCYNLLIRIHLIGQNMLKISNQILLRQYSINKTSKHSIYLLVVSKHMPYRVVMHCYINRYSLEISKQLPVNNSQQILS